MYEVIVPQKEYWDQANECFIYTKSGKFVIEHSLVSISKWESKWKKPFFGKDEKTKDEIIDYIRLMTITQNVDPDLYDSLPNETINSIIEYMNDPHTATKLPEDKDNKNKSQSSNKEILTSELIYYYMFSAQISKECEKWNINRLLTLLGVFGVKNKAESDKISGKNKGKAKKPDMARRAALNAERKNKLHTSG